MVIVIRCNNGIVTDKYLDLIGNSLKNDKYGDVKYVSCYKDVLKYQKNSIVVAARIMDAVPLLLRGYNNMIMWFQGIEPEESYMSHHSKFRMQILSKLEKYVLKKSIFKFFVSKEMLLHYEKKYNLRIEDGTYYCMPCLNTTIHPMSFKTEKKYENNYFAYVGSMAVWQKFEETVKLYKEIEQLGMSNTKLFVFTGDKAKAVEILEKNDVKDYSIDFVSNEELPKALESMKYGFIVREDTAVNRVATPTKISTYLSCGLIPIYSECLKDFGRIAQSMNYVICCDKSMKKKLLDFNDAVINPNSIFNEYNNIFDTYYSEKEHFKYIKQLLGKKMNH